MEVHSFNLPICPNLYFLLSPKVNYWFGYENVPVKLSEWWQSMNVFIYILYFKESGLINNSLIYYMTRKDQFKPEPPKKPMCAFFLYRMDIYPQVKDKFPGYRIT